MLIRQAITIELQLSTTLTLRSSLSGFPITFGGETFPNDGNLVSVGSTVSTIEFENTPMDIVLNYQNSVIRAAINNTTYRFGGAIVRKHIMNDDGTIASTRVLKSGFLDTHQAPSQDGTVTMTISSFAELGARGRSDVSARSTHQNNIASGLYPGFTGTDTIFDNSSKDFGRVRLGDTVAYTTGGEQIGGARPCSSSDHVWNDDPVYAPIINHEAREGVRLGNAAESFSPPVAYGRVKINPVLVDARNPTRAQVVAATASSVANTLDFDLEEHTDEATRYLSLIFVLAHGRVDTLEMTVNDSSVSMSLDVSDGVDIEFISFSGDSTSAYGYAYAIPGSSTGLPAFTTHLNNLGFRDDIVSAGHCTVAVTISAQAAWGGKIPEFTFIAGGTRIRAVNSTGFSTTRSVRNDIASVIGDYLTNDIYGLGLDDSRINHTSLLAANTANNSVTGTIYPTTLRGSVTGSGSYGSFLESMLTSASMRLYEDEEGLVSLWFGQEVTDSDIAARFQTQDARSGANCTVTQDNPRAREVLNEIEGKYFAILDEANKAPDNIQIRETVTDTALVTQDFGIKSRTDIDLDFLTGDANANTQATSAAHRSLVDEQLNLRLRKSRIASLRVTINTDFNTARGVNIGDVVSVDASEYGWTGADIKLFLVTDIEDDNRGAITLRGQEHSNTIYGGMDSFPNIRVEQGIPTTSDFVSSVLPTVGVPQTPAVTFDGSNRRFVFTWAAPLTGASRVASYEVRHRISGDTEWTTSLVGADSTTFALVVAEAGTYQFEVKSVSAQTSSAFTATVSAAATAATIAAAVNIRTTPNQISASQIGSTIVTANDTVKVFLDLGASPQTFDSAATNDAALSVGEWRFSNLVANNLTAAASATQTSDCLSIDTSLVTATGSVSLNIHYRVTTTTVETYPVVINSVLTAGGGDGDSSVLQRAFNPAPTTGTAPAAPAANEEYPGGNWFIPTLANASAATLSGTQVQAGDVHTATVLTVELMGSNTRLTEAQADSVFEVGQIISTAPAGTGFTPSANTYEITDIRADGAGTGSALDLMLLTGTGDDIERDYDIFIVRQVATTALNWVSERINTVTSAGVTTFGTWTTPVINTGINGTSGANGLPGVATTVEYNNRRSTANEIAAAEGRYGLFSGVNAVPADSGWSFINIIQINDTTVTDRLRSALVPDRNHIRIFIDEENWGFFEIDSTPTQVGTNNAVTSYSVEHVISRGLASVALNSNIPIAIGFDAAVGERGEAAITVDVDFSQDSVVSASDGTYSNPAITVEGIWRAGSTDMITRTLGTLNVAADGTVTFAQDSAAENGVTLDGVVYTPNVTFTAATNTVSLQTAGITDTHSLTLIDITSPDIRNIIYLDIPANIDTVTTPADSPGVPTVPFTNDGIDYTWTDLPPVNPTGVIWTSEGVQSNGQGDFDWGDPQRTTGLAGLSTRLDFAYGENTPEVQDIGFSGTRSNVVAPGVSNEETRFFVPERFVNGFTGLAESPDQIVNAFNFNTYYIGARPTGVTGGVVLGTSPGNVWTATIQTARGGVLTQVSLNTNAWIRTLPASATQSIAVAVPTSSSVNTPTLGAAITIRELVGATQVYSNVSATVERRIIPGNFVDELIVNLPDDADTSEITQIIFQQGDRLFRLERTGTGTTSGDTVQYGSDGFLLQTFTIALLAESTDLFNTGGTVTVVREGIADQQITGPSATTMLVEADTEWSYRREDIGALTWSFDPDTNNAVFTAGNTAETGLQVSTSRNNAAQLATEVRAAILAAGQTTDPNIPNLTSTAVTQTTFATSTIQIDFTRDRDGNTLTYPLGALTADVTFFRNLVYYTSTDVRAEDADSFAGTVTLGDLDTAVTMAQWALPLIQGYIPAGMTASRSGSTITISGNRALEVEINPGYAAYVEMNTVDGPLRAGFSSFSTAGQRLGREFTVNLGTNTPLLEALVVNQNSANDFISFTPIGGDPTSLYTYRDYAGQQIVQITSFVSDVNARDVDDVVSGLARAGTDNIENPVDFLVTREGSNLRHNARVTGSVNGTFSVVVDNGTIATASRGNITFDAATVTQEGSNVVTNVQYPTGTIGTTYVSARPLASSNFIGERIVTWGDGEDEPAVSRNVNDYNFSRIT